MSVPLRSSSTDIHPNANWNVVADTVTRGNGAGPGLNQLDTPLGLYVDDEQTVYIAEYENHRIMEWRSGAMTGRVVAGGNGQGSGAHQLNTPYDVIVDKRTDSLIISDNLNKRVVRWPRQNGARGETIISNIECVGLTMDDKGFLYVVDWGNHLVRRYEIGDGDTTGTVVAGGNGQGDRLDQLFHPHNVFVDRERSVYVSDQEYHRVMKWKEDAAQGSVVAGGEGRGRGPTQLSKPRGVVVDQLGTVYVAERWNNRITRWPQGARRGSVIAGSNTAGNQLNQLDCPVGLSFDRQGNLYVADSGNHRVQRFNIVQNLG